MNDNRKLFDWYRFKSEVIRRPKLFWTRETHKFLKEIVKTDRVKIKKFDSGTIYFRVRNGAPERKHIRDMVLPEKPYVGKDMGIPPRKKRGKGRAHTSGMGCLYLATDLETAIVEARSYKGKNVSVVQFKATDDLKLVDFRDDNYKGLFLPADLSYFFNGKVECDVEDIKRIIWSQINFDFAKPIAPLESKVEYMPTQIISKALMAAGFCGIVYSSSLTFTGGCNIVLFGDNLVEQLTDSAELRVVDKIIVESKRYEHNSAKRIRTILDGMRVSR